MRRRIAAVRSDRGNQPGSGRRWLVGATIAVIAASIGSATPAPPAPVTAEPTTPRPNIVLIVMDDWGFTDIGAFGGEIRTPNIDALARAGVRFADFHVAGSCAPTRAMLQTGVSNHRAGLGDMPETIPPEHLGKPGYDTVMNDRVATIAQRLHTADYRTYFSGKWHLGKTPDKLPGARGYDHATVMPDAGADNFEQKPIYGLHDRVDWSEDGKPLTLPADYYSSTFIVDKAIGYIDAGRGSGRPFLASVNFMANHIPVQAPDAYLARYAGHYREGWQELRAARAARAAALGIVPAVGTMATLSTTRDWQGLTREERDAQARYMQAYGAMAEAADHEIGRLINHLKATGDYTNTVFVLLSDNGPEPTDPRNRWINRLLLDRYYDFDPAHAGQRGTMTYIGPSWASALAAPLSGYKFTAGEGGLRVPLIIAWPGNPAIKAGTIAHRFAHVTDVAPTLLDLAQVPNAPLAAEPITGVSLKPMLTGQADAAHTPDAPLGYELTGNAALFKGDYKLVKNLPPTGDSRWHLYDIVRDPGETRDLGNILPDQMRAMIADYQAYARRDQVLPMPPGYTAAAQINENAFRETGLPLLERAGAVLVGVIALLIALVWAWRRRRAVRS
uniref:arylsulfatase n=1 Tax=Sphingomonas sp. GlSt437 TaxID=3389970 RepID=UPI003A87BD99